MAQIHYPKPIHLQACYKDLGYKIGDFPVSEAVGKRILSLPLYPELTNIQIQSVVKVISDFINSQ